jgi:hypothetical protein
MQADLKDVRLMMSKVLSATAVGEVDTDSSSLVHGSVPIATTALSGTASTVAQAPASTMQSTGGGGQHHAAHRKGGGHA